MIRPATSADILPMLHLERQSPTLAHWTEQQYQHAVEPADGDFSRLVLILDEVPAESSMSAVALSGSHVQGFLVARHLAPEWELENIVIAPNARRHGLATRLLGHLLDYARETNSEAVFLEVRESNAAARTLYQRAGFEQVGRRKAYYADPLEDAILYRHTLKVRPFS